ncbi:heparan-alpha-glucosaminide N-acetyltransferase [Microdochium nivale]|nr:heparan-alpha-glucosaminide N-acetyltransferase [Microdochium nivale]
MEPQETQFSTEGAPGSLRPAGADGHVGSGGGVGDGDAPASRHGYGTSTQPPAPIATPAQDNISTSATVATVAAAATAVATVRAVGPDLLRGLLMVIMAMDHTVVSINSWSHGQGRISEGDGAPVTQWNRPIGYAVRTMTHLCAPGFFFLLGMGIAYFGRSRSRLGWSASRMARHFAIRAAVLTALTVLMGLMMGLGRIWFLNVVLFALGVDYLVVGLLWLLISRTEPALARLCAKTGGGGGGGGWGIEARHDEEDAARRPLLSSSASAPAKADPSRMPGARASYHIHNLALLVLVGVTIWWNIWLSPAGGHCVSTDDNNSNNNNSVSATAGSPFPGAGTSFVDFWFHVYATEHIISAFPPMGWLSFAIAGLLYARFILRPSATAARIRGGTLLASLLLAVSFVLTRLLHFGNLSEGCLHAPDQQQRTTPGNQYLASPQAFFYLVKYPPDVAFFAYTLAVDLLLLTALDLVPRHLLPATALAPPKTTATTTTTSSSKTATAIATIQRAASRLATAALSVLLTFGNSALFFYMAHQIIVFGAGSLIASSALGADIPGEKNPFNEGKPLRGVQSVWAFWALWMFVMVVMYPLCRWYARFKSTKGVDSVWRFF